MGSENRSNPSSTSDPPLEGLPRVHDSDDYTSTDQTAIIPPKSVRSAQYPAIVAMAGGASGQVFRIVSDETTVGRRDADIILADPGISRLHCKIVRTGPEELTLVDNGSTNGTIVNGTAIKEPVVLRAGDRIQLGPDAVLQFNLYDEAEEDLAKRLYEAATRDGLTRALNRRAFDERFDAELAYARRHNERLVALTVDIDHFKRINDGLGHATGDVVLKTVAAVVMQALRGEDILGRYGGEEFVLLARGLNVEDGGRLAERVRVAIENLRFSGSRSHLRVTVSIGVAELAEVGILEGAGARLLELSDKRLYQAKNSGRNRVVFE